jgi:alkanesulfonate monooxygenase SsuD/methylene tetrahydromethanopterin reductase-like flavin-dependent oxidoreductase (luciferase family)
MGTLEFALWDGFGAHEMAALPMAADVYAQQIREAQLAEELGYESYYSIEHQNSLVGQITAPSIYLCAVAQHTTCRRIGVMPTEQSLKSLPLFGKEVIPAFT